MTTLRIVAAAIRDPAGRLLLVRKRGTTAFMQPGGKLEPGETPAQALVRELEEELGLAIDPQALGHLGRFGADAANEAGWRVDCDIYTAPYPGPVTVRAEIEEARWVDIEAPGGLTLAPLIRDHLLPRIAGLPKPT